MNYESGATWKKWDLHVHTPYSLVHHFKGIDDEERWENYINDLEQLPQEVKVLGINDYLFIDGYIKLLEFKEKGRLANIDTLFPVIEFRVKKFAGHKEFKRINFHVIFSETLDPNTIQTQFLNSLQGKYKLSPGLEGLEWNAAVTKESLTDLGSQIKESVSDDQLSNYGSDILEGFNNLNLDEEQIITLLTSNSYLKDKYILAVGKTEWESLRWGDSSIAEKKDSINKVDLVFISSENPSAYENARMKLREQNVNDKLLDCSDAHFNFSSTNKDRIGKCFTWIKADTTFEGLRHSIYEFDDRIYVGDVPPEVGNVNKNPAKYISELTINPVDGKNIPETWFTDIPTIKLNSGLVAIIGNKGNGKSAIADILSLLGNSHNYSSFSFLNSKKFLKKKPYNRGDAFEASMKWVSNQVVSSIKLSSLVDETISETVKYLPQSYLEKICAEEIESSNFESELKQVVFSHMDNTKKMGLFTFDEYIHFKTTEISKRIRSLKVNLSAKNQEISELEKKKLPSYIKMIRDKKAVKESDLEVHIKNKPKEIKPPNEDKAISDENKKNMAELKQLEDLNIEYTKKINDLEKENTAYHLIIDRHKKAIKALNEVSDKIKLYYKDYSDFYIENDFNIEDVIKYEINENILTESLNNKISKLNSNNSLLNVENEKSFTYKLKSILVKIETLKKQLTEPQRLYERYKENLKKWEKDKKDIIGDKNKENSVEFYNYEIKFLANEIDSNLKNLNKERLDITRKIFKEKNEVMDLYNDAYKPVTELIANHEQLKSFFAIEFTSFYKLEGFQDSFLKFINQTLKGSFNGATDGYNMINEIVESLSLESFEDLDIFIEEIIKHLTIDQRDGKNYQSRHITEQLKKNFESSDIYDFLYGLDYIDVNYKLKLSGKDVTELSPGERGTLLLVFYLLIDKSNIPLIIDQPEENLDNQSVYDILVKFIQEAKRRRQVIIVTHNPNLAVVCDADQIIRVNIEKENKNKFTFLSGAIENPLINQEIVKILEGTKPAFTNRKLKYENIKKDI